MYENANGIMVPDTVIAHDLYTACHYGTVETVIEVLGEYGPLNAMPCLEDIDGDPSIKIALAAYGL